jgi:hypothetical protein
MIIWLASYPRSGNTLLRTILKQTMGLGSYSDEALRAALGLTETAESEFGHIPIEEPWEQFYRKASASADVHLVKTHLPPRDAQPVIYVVRDGRQALVSYDNYHRKFFPEHPGGLMHLVLGDDYYGGWSEHHAAWFAERRPAMLVRYEELVDASAVLLQKIAHFIDHTGPVARWTNPFEKLHQGNPGFFRQGEVSWKGAPGWTPLVDGAFFQIHGELMRKLHYADESSLEKSCTAFGPDLAQFVDLARSLVHQKQDLDRVCHERLAVINVLDAEVKRLSATPRDA